MHTWSQCGSSADARWCSQGLAINNIASNAWGEEMYHSRSGYTWILLPVTLTYPTSSHPLSFLTSLDYFHLIVENVFQALLPLYKNNSDRMTERGYKLCEHRRIKCERGAGSGIVKMRNIVNLQPWWRRAIRIHQDQEPGTARIRHQDVSVAGRVIRGSSIVHTFTIKPTLRVRKG